MFSVLAVSAPFVVEMTEEVTNHRFVPPGVVGELPHNEGEPATPGSPGAEYPDDVLRLEAGILSGLSPGYHRAQGGNLLFPHHQVYGSLLDLSHARPV